MGFVVDLKAAVKNRVQLLQEMFFRLRSAADAARVDCAPHCD